MCFLFYRKDFAYNIVKYFRIPNIFQIKKAEKIRHKVEIKV